VAEEHDGLCGRPRPSKANLQEIAEFALAMPPDPATERLSPARSQVDTTVYGRLVIAGGLKLDK
jgi:hypothetical protein